MPYYLVADLGTQLTVYMIPYRLLMIDHLTPTYLKINEAIQVDGEDSFAMSSFTLTPTSSKYRCVEIFLMNHVLYTVVSLR